MTIAEKYNLLSESLKNSPNNPPTSFNFKKAGNNEIAKLIYDNVVANIQEAKQAGDIKPGEDLSALGITAQILFESTWGKSDLSSKYNNFGGIKADKNWKGNSVQLRDGNGNMQSWRVFPTLKDGLKEQVYFYIDNPRYRKAGVFNTKSPQEHLQKVTAAGYAEPDYAQKIGGLLNKLPEKLSKYNPEILEQWKNYSEISQVNTQPTNNKQNFSPQVPNLPNIKPFMEMGLGLTVNIDKSHPIVQAMENAGKTEYLEKQVNTMEDPLFKALLKPINVNSKAKGGFIVAPSNGQELDLSILNYGGLLKNRFK